MNIREAVKMLRATSEMEQLFDERTKHHVSLVQKYAKVLAEKFPELSELVEAAKLHDESKWSDEERPGYVQTTWSYKTTGKPASKTITGSAWKHHQEYNDHHPEYWKSVTEMPDLALAHAVADWAAMSEELGTSLVAWVKQNALTRWQWTPDQIKRINQFVKVTGRP